MRHYRNLTCEDRRAELAPSVDISCWRLHMSSIDDLAFDIAFALSQKPIGAEARKRIGSLP